MNIFDIVIIGGLHHNTLGVLRSLGEQGVHCDNINVLIVGKNIHKNNIISSSKYINSNKVHYVDTNDDIISWLIKLSKDGKRRTVICCSDGSAEVVIKNKDILKQNFNTPSTSYDVEKLMSKQIQGELAIQSGFNIPTSTIIKASEYRQGNWEKYPCITKPLKSVSGSGKADIHVSNNEQELLQALSETDAEFVQIQEYLQKKLEYQLIGCSLNNGEILIIPGYTDIIRQPNNTNTGYLLYSPIDKFSYNKNAVETFIKMIGYNGLFSMEFIRDLNDTDYFLEINMRNDGNAYCVKTAGVNLPYIWCYYQTEHVLPKENTKFNKPVYFMPEFNDIKRGIKTVGVLKWMIQFFQAKSHAIFNTRDMKPFIVKIIRAIFK